ncbi:MBL fold metallo-hydrolase [Salinibaculum rarum]|uniref:MBL fold metallo-hydrolase n=1 Tax=Salinibaculum rarum TaxID=3058903 RepID=UPI00265D9125|nr:MBL fold metallo-hydrolase [Salinibaculum sp. KK48]
MEITDGVYAFPQTIERDGAERTFYPSAVDTPTGLLLVDVGLQGQVEQIEANLTEAGFDWDDVRGVIITHQDGDHAGALSAVLERTDATVYTHAGCSPYVDGRKHPIKSSDDERYPPVGVDVALVGGVAFRTEAGPMDVVFTPGHTPGHISLHLPDAGVLLAADATVADEDGLAGPDERFTLDMDEALESLAKLATLEFDRTLCHHGGLVDEGTSRLAALVDDDL